MSELKRTASSGPELSGPGILYSASRITVPDILSDDLFNRWYNKVHVPDVLATGAITAAWRFRNADPEAHRPYLAIYLCPDMTAIHGDKFKSISMKHEVIPQGKSIHELATFDTRFYLLTQEFEKEEQEGGFFPNLLTAGMEPGKGQADDLEAWYREEHLEQMSKEPGWRRSTRYTLVRQVKDANKPSTTEDAPSFLTLYEFDETAKLGKQVQPLDPMTGWTKRCVANAKRIEAAVYHRMKMFD